MSSQLDPAAVAAEAFVGRLRAAGMTTSAADAKCELFRRVLNALPSGVMEGEPPYMLFVPGRIEVLGKHTDYAGGRSLLAAAERGFCVAAVPREDNRVSVFDVERGRRTEFKLAPETTGTTGDWSAYPMTVARRVARNFPGPLRGADIAFLSDLPPASGMSSSSAMMIAVFQVFNRMNALADRPEARAAIHSTEDLAGYLATIENGRSFGALAGDRGVGTFGGSEDHTAICCCRAGHLYQYSFCPTRQERILPMPPGFCFAIAYCGVLAEKTGAAMDKYNRASQLVAALVELWQADSRRSEACLADVVHSAPDAVDRLHDIVVRRPHAGFDSADLLQRLEHFLDESEQIIPAAANALAGGQIDEFGRLVDRSQAGSEQLLGNQVPQTVHLARSARECGAAAASAFGAGFGGSVWALVEQSAAETFLAEWAEQYRKAFPDEAEHAAFFATGAGPCLQTSAWTMDIAGF